jgi:hypothetical protein
MRIRAAAGLMVATLWAPVIAVADDGVTLADLSRGDQVRVRLTSGGEPVRGTIDAAGPAEIVVRPRDPAQPALRLSPQQMAKLEVARGRRSHWARGAAIGFVPGALLLGVAGTASAECDPDCDHTGEALAYACVGGAITSAVGALVGLAIRTDRWVVVQERRPKLALTLAPVKSGFQADLSFSF